MAEDEVHISVTEYEKNDTLVNDNLPMQSTEDAQEQPSKDVEQHLEENVNIDNEEVKSAEKLTIEVNEDHRNSKLEYSTSQNEVHMKENEHNKETSVADYDHMSLERVGSVEIQECLLGQEILNALFGTHDIIEPNTNFDEIDLTSPRKSAGVESLTISEIIINRVDVISKLKEAMGKMKDLVGENQVYQQRLVEYFKLMKAKQKVVNKPISDKDVLIDFNTQYEKYREILKALMDDLECDENKYNEKIDRLRVASEIKTQQNENSYKDFIRFEETIGLSAIHSRTGFKLEPDVIKDFFQTESKKETIIKVERLCNLKLEHKNMRFDKSLRSKENVQGGLRLIDFEQLKIENQTFNEKVEERREAIKKLNRKIANCNNLLSHIKEKISFTDNVKRTSNLKLNLLNKEFKRLQKITNQNKRVRDYIKTNNRNLQMSCGLLGKPDYLRKFEETMDDVERKKKSIDNIDANMKDITQSSRGLVKKISFKKGKS